MEEPAQIDECESLYQELEACQDEECVSPAIIEELQQCEQSSEKADLQDLLLGRLAQRAQACFDKQDAECMYWVYRALAAGGQAQGLYDAARNMSHFLSKNCSETLVVPKELLTSDPSFDWAKEETLKILRGLSAQLSPGDATDAILPSLVVNGVQKPLYYAMGSYTLTPSAYITKLPNGDVDLQVTFEAFDIYDWHSDKGVTIGNSHSFRDEFAQLIVDAGLGCPFDMRASWSESFYLPR